MGIVRLRIWGERMKKNFVLFVLVVSLIGMSGVGSAAVDINNVGVSAIKTDSVRIGWDSTVPGTSQIEYGTTISYGSITSEDSLSYFHTQTISGLSTGTLYHYRIRSKEYGGAETISPDYTFTTRTQAELEAVIKAARADGGLPKTYYVKTDGNNASDGLTIATAWQTPSYAVLKADAGDTIYLIDDPANPSDGIWNDEHIVFSRSGIDVAPITLTAYNGTPILDGLDKTGYGISMRRYNYTLVSGLKIKNYQAAIDMVGIHNTVSNCELSDTSDVVIGTGSSSHYQTIENCTLYNSGWNTIQVTGNHEPPNGNGIPSSHITIRNNKIYNSNVHNAIDLYGNLENVIIEGNELYNNNAGNIYSHDDPDWKKNIIIRNNYFHDSPTGAINMGLIYDVIIENNIFKNLRNYPIELYLDGDNFTIQNNSFYNSLSPRIFGGIHNVIFDSNYIHDDSGIYTVSYASDAVFRNSLGKT